MNLIQKMRKNILGFSNIGCEHPCEVQKVSDVK